MEAYEDELASFHPRHIGSGGDRLWIEIQPIDLPAFAGHASGFPFRTSMRE